MSVKLFGFRADGARVLIGTAPGPEKMLDFAFALNEMLEGYPRAMMSDDAAPPDGLQIWTVYDHPRDWPGWYVARLVINEHRTGNLLLHRKLDELRELLVQLGLTPLMRSEKDDPVILETWL